MTGEILDQHLDTLAEDIKTGNVQEAQELAMGDFRELGTLSPEEATKFRPVISDEAHLAIAATTCLRWHDHHAAA